MSCKSKAYTTKAVYRFFATIITILAIALFAIYVVPMEIARWNADQSKRDSTLDQLNQMHDSVVKSVIAISIVIGTASAGRKYFKEKKKCPVCSKQ